MFPLPGVSWSPGAAGDGGCTQRAPHCLQTRLCPWLEVSVRCCARDNIHVTCNLQAGFPVGYEMKADCLKSASRRERSPNFSDSGRRSQTLPALSCSQAFGLVLILQKNDRKNIGSGVLMIITSSVELMHCSQGHLIRSLFLMGEVLVPCGLNRLNQII